MKALGTHALLVLLFCADTSLLRAGDASDAFDSWSAFRKLDLDKLAAGTVLTQCNSAMKFPRGLCAQAAFLVAAPLEVTSRVLLESDPTKHAELAIYQYRRFQNAGDAAFDKLVLDPKIKAVRNLLAAMPKRDDLQLARGEEAGMPKGGAPGDAGVFWANVLRERWGRAALQGDLGGAGEYDTRSEITALLAEESDIAQHFDPLLTPLIKPAAPLSAASYYWQVAEINNRATCELGAILTRTAEGRSQILDLTFYASGGFLTSVTLYELVPVMRSGKPCTLVWQGCLVSAPGLAGGFGLKRKIASVLTLNELERSTRLFQQDAARAAEGRTR